MPSHIGRYEVLGQLGAGGMGTVYLARDPGGDTVAVKVVHERLVADPGFLARFAAEVAAARRVAGFCTARVLDADVRPPRPFLVTEYVPGPTLAQVLSEQGRLPASQVEALGVGVAAALTAIHAAGVVHRDLKPSNVLLSAFGPKVIDFGVAKARDATAHTEAGLVFGTLGWMAPEQLHGMATAASDVYVWGLLVAHAGAGWQPGSAPPAAVLGALPRALAELAAAALDPDPARRPAARELLLRLCGSAAPAQVRTATAVLTRPWNPTYPPPAIAPYAGVPARRAPVPRPPLGRRPVYRRPVYRRPAPVPGRPPVAWRRRRWYRRKRVLIPVILLIILAILNNGDSSGEGALPERTARDGILEFTATGVSCAHRSLGSGPLARRAQGQLCAIALRVRNFGGDTRRVHVSSQKLRDRAGRTFSADAGAWIYLPEAVPFRREINPGNEITGTLVYDIAADAVPVKLEVHDSPLSGGATLTL